MLDLEDLCVCMCQRATISSLPVAFAGLCLILLLPRLPFICKLLLPGLLLLLLLLLPHTLLLLLLLLPLLQLRPLQIQIRPSSVIVVVDAMERGAHYAAGACGGLDCGGGGQGGGEGAWWVGVGVESGEGEGVRVRRVWDGGGGVRRVVIGIVDVGGLSVGCAGASGVGAGGTGIGDVIEV